jgi:hypothetical protein
MGDVHSSTYPYLGYHRPLDDLYWLYPSIYIYIGGIASYTQSQSFRLSSARSSEQTYRQGRFPTLSLLPRTSYRQYTLWQGHTVLDLCIRRLEW